MLIASAQFIKYAFYLTRMDVTRQRFGFSYRIESPGHDGCPTDVTDSLDQAGAQHWLETTSSRLAELGNSGTAYFGQSTEQKRQKAPQAPPSLPSSARPRLSFLGAAASYGLSNFPAPSSSHTPPAPTDRDHASAAPLSRPHPARSTAAWPETLGSEEGGHAAGGAATAACAEDPFHDDWDAW